MTDESTVLAEREACAKMLDARGVSSCERGTIDYSTGAFECRRLERGECNCSEFDELAEEIRARPAPDLCAKSAQNPDAESGDFFAENAKKAEPPADAMEVAGLCERLRALIARASQGPWFQTGAPWFSDGSGVVAGSPDGNIACVIADCDDGLAPRDEYEGPFRIAEDPAADAELIVEMYGATPKLIDAIESLTAKRDAADRRAADAEARAKKAERELAEARAVTDEMVKRARQAYTDEIERIDAEEESIVDGDDDAHDERLAGVSARIMRAALTAALGGE